VTSGMLT